MKNLFFIALVFISISCSKNTDIENNVSNHLKNRLLLLELYGTGRFYLRDSIFEHYENGLIVKKEHFLKPLEDSPFYPYFFIYEYNQNNLLEKVKLYIDIDTKEIIETKTYYYTSDLNIEKIDHQRTKPSLLSNNLFHSTIYYEYNLDTVRKYKINHLNGQKEDEVSYVVKGDLDSVINITSNYLYLFDKQNDLYKIEYLGDSLDVWSWQTDIYYGDDREPLIENFTGSKLNQFLMPNPIKYYDFELTNKYRESMFIHTHRTNETIRYNYLFNGENYLPSQVIRGGTFYSGDVIKYFYND